MQVLVIGDWMLDIYQYGKISRVSPEAPVPVILNAHAHYKAGGAANVAVNLASLGVDVELAGIVGKDKNADSLFEIFKEHSLKYHAVVSRNQPTITKQRVIGNDQHIVRMDTEGDFASESALLFPKMKNLKTEWVVLSDYNKGTLADIQNYIQHFNSTGVKTIVDPKKEISAYKGAWFIKPNRNEFVQYIGAFANHQELISLAQEAIQKYQFSHMLVTLGEEGMMHVEENKSKFYPAHPQKVLDITGAGDTVLLGLVYGWVHGKSMGDSILLAKRWAELSVTKIGTYVMQKADI